MNINIHSSMCTNEIKRVKLVNILFSNQELITDYTYFLHSTVYPYLLNDLCLRKILEKQLSKLLQQLMNGSWSPADLEESKTDER